MAHDDGTILAEELYPVAAACGQSTEQVRSFLRRMVTQGSFTRTGSGQSAVYRATEKGLAQMASRLQRAGLAYRQDAAGQGWDGHWRIVAFAVPEAQRSARDDLRDFLLELGGAAIQGGLYISPHPWDDDVRREALRLGLAEHLTLAASDSLEVGGVRDARALAATLWPLDEVADRYRRFVARHSHVPDDLEAMRRSKTRLADAEFLPLTFGMAVAYNECASIDPYLPPELLPRPWPGRAARNLIVRYRRLALMLRAEAAPPALFRLFDKMILDELR
jgi:phenylacetic acid degradation operon negative regulatory protein